MTTKQPKRPRDMNQWAKRMVDLATGEAEDRLWEMSDIVDVLQTWEQS